MKWAALPLAANPKIPTSHGILSIKPSGCPEHQATLSNKVRCKVGSAAHK